jgi:hypothetical protein
MAIKKRTLKKRWVKPVGQETPQKVLDEYYLAVCDAEDDSAQGFYIIHRDVRYWIASNGAWIPSIL